MSDSSFNSTPPDISNPAREISNKLLPEKSRRSYEKAYQDFINWKISKGSSKSFSEEVLLVYFQDLSKKFKSSSLWTFYSMLKSTLSINHKVDISKYSKLITLLKRKGEGYTGKKSKTFSPDEINGFLSQAPDQLYLAIKTVLIFGTMGACRRQELYALLYTDVQINENVIVVNVNNTKTKTNRTFTITGKYLEICKKYIALRPDPCSNPSFFLQYRSGKCISQKMGINTFSSLGKIIANYLQLPNPELYTGHCFRRTSATILVDAGGDITSLKRHGGWKSTSVAEGYINDSITNKIHVSNIISNSIENKNSEVVNINIPPSTSGSGPSTFKEHQVNFNNCTIQNVNYYYNK